MDELYKFAKWLEENNYISEVDDDGVIYFSAEEILIRYKSEKINEMQ